jgi:hypothetical protein
VLLANRDAVSAISLSESAPSLRSGLLAVKDAVATGPDGRRQHAVAEIAQAVGVHRTTVYAYLSNEG